MIDVSKILRNKNSTNFFSFIIGLGLAILLFHKPFGYKQFLSLPVSDIEGKIIKVDDKCYSYKSEDVKCS
jgi:hypothetical protein